MNDFDLDDNSTRHCARDRDQPSPSPLAFAHLPLVKIHAAAGHVPGLVAVLDRKPVLLRLLPEQLRAADAWQLCLDLQASAAPRLRQWPSVTSTGPSTRASASRSGTRPSTASGRKSRTATTSSIVRLGEQQNIVCAVGESRGVTPSVGVAFINVSLGQVILSQICDNQSYVKTIHKIQMASPSRIVFVSSACLPTSPSTLFTLAQELLPEAQCDAFDRSAWSEHAGLDYIQTLAFPSDVGPVKVALQGKYYAVCSFAAVSNAYIVGIARID